MPKRNIVQIKLPPEKPDCCATCPLVGLVPKHLRQHRSKETHVCLGTMEALIIKLINSVGDVINNDTSIDGKIKVVFIEDYRVSNAEWIFAAADVSARRWKYPRQVRVTLNSKLPGARKIPQSVSG